MADKPTPAKPKMDPMCLPQHKRLAMGEGANQSPANYGRKVPKTPA